MEDLRDKIISVCRRLDQLGFVPATDGNVSARLDKDTILITPSMVAKGSLTAEQLLVVGMDGKVRRGDGKPSSEMPMHLMVYWLRPDVNAVVHAHPAVATAFAAARQALAEPVLPEMVLTLGPVPLAQYATPSTDEVPRSIEKLIAVCNALLLANHGALTVGRDLNEALQRMERLEHLAKIVLVSTMLGGAKTLTASDIAHLKDVNGQVS